jgi:hypothetical protein
MPQRVCLRRSRGWRLPPGAVSVAYPSKWANPFRHVRPRAASVRRYREYLSGHPELLAALSELRAKDLACWCPLDQPCHADVLLELANPLPPEG